MNIREYKTSDFEAVWNIFKEVITTEDNFVFSKNTTHEEFKIIWFGINKDTFIVEENGTILGSYFIKPNQPDLGSHIANCGYMVSAQARGKGLGSILCDHSIQFAKTKGYIGIQFNIVVSTNLAAVHLWEKHGFEIIGTTPKGFNHNKLGLVDSYIMYKAL